MGSPPTPEQALAKGGVVNERVVIRVGVAMVDITQEMEVYWQLGQH